MVGALAVLLFFGIVAIAVAALLYLSLQTIVMYAVMRRWPRVPGIAHQARLLTSSRRNSAIMMEVDVEYEVGGRRRRRWCGVPDRTGFAVAGNDRSAARERLFERYSGGKAIEIIVNPLDPDEAYLRMPSLLVLFMMLFGAVAFPAAILLPMQD